MRACTGGVVQPRWLCKTPRAILSRVSSCHYPPLQRELHQSIVELCRPDVGVMAAALQAAAHGTSPSEATPPAFPTGQPAQLIEQAEQRFAEELRQARRWVGVLVQLHMCCAAGQRGGLLVGMPCCDITLALLMPVFMLTCSQAYNSLCSLAPPPPQVVEAGDHEAQAAAALRLLPASHHAALGASPSAFAQLCNELQHEIHQLMVQQVQQQQAAQQQPGVAGDVNFPVRLDAMHKCAVLVSAELAS